MTNAAQEGARKRASARRRGNETTQRVPGEPWQQAAERGHEECTAEPGRTRKPRARQAAAHRRRPAQASAVRGTGRSRTIPRGTWGRTTRPTRSPRGAMLAERKVSRPADRDCARDARAARRPPIRCDCTTRRLVRPSRGGSGRGRARPSREPPRRAQGRATSSIAIGCNDAMRSRCEESCERATRRVDHGNQPSADGSASLKGGPDRTVSALGQADMNLAAIPACRNAALAAKLPNGTPASIPPNEGTSDARGGFERRSAHARPHRARKYVVALAPFGRFSPGTRSISRRLPPDRGSA